MGRRERTRAALLTAALELFAQHGYDATTAAAIAQRAGVTEMTFFRHFATKAAVLVEDPYDPLIEAAIHDRPDDERPLVAAIAGIRIAWEAVTEPEAEAVRDRLRVIAATPGLRSTLTAGMTSTEQAIADGLTARGTPPPEARVVASAVIAGLNTALLDWSLGDESNLGSALETAFRALGSGS